MTLLGTKMSTHGAKVRRAKPWFRRLTLAEKHTELQSNITEVAEGLVK